MDQEEIPEEKKRFLKLFLQAWKLKKDKAQQQEQEQQQEEQQQQENENEQQEDGQQQDESQQQQDKSLVFSREEYAQNQFWEDRYKEHKGNFDWYVEWAQLKKYLEESNMKIDKKSSILMVGCGNSKLSEQMYQNGYENILSIDISETIVQRMQEQADKKNMKLKYLVMDATDTKFEDQLFDVAIDKGTLDALACGDQEPSRKLLKEMTRIAKQIIIISHSSHKKRLNLVHQEMVGRKVLEVKVFLSGQSELINIMRTHLKNKPLSHILKDKKALVACLEEYKIQQRQLKMLPEESIQEHILEQGEYIEQQAKNDEIQYDPRRQSYCYLYKII